MNSSSDFLRHSQILALAPEEQQEALAELGEQLFTRVIARSLAVMPESDRETLSGLLSAQADGERVMGFLNERVPNFATVIGEEATALREDRLALLSSTEDNQNTNS